MNERRFSLTLAGLHANTRERPIAVSVGCRRLLPSRIPLRQNYLVNVIDQEVQELVRVLLHVVIELLLLLSQSGYELFRGNRSHLLLLRGDVIKQIREACEKCFLGPLILGLVVEDLVPEWFAEIQCL